MNYHGLRLTLAMKSCVELLVILQGPRLSEPHNNVTSILKVQTVAAAGWVHNHYRKLACVPLINMFLGFQLYRLVFFKVFQDSSLIVLEVSRDQYRLSVGVLYNILQSLIRLRHLQQLSR